jgi:hypothetical protein
MTAESFVPADFAVPEGLVTADFRLEPLRPRHNEADYAAWSSRMDHIRATPGFARWRWPYEMSLEDNRRDLERHERDFGTRRGFTYTVLSQSTGDVIGCVYIYPPRDKEPGTVVTRDGRADVQSWVRATSADLDPVLYAAVLAWLERDWPFTAITYAQRG